MSNALLKKFPALAQYAEPVELPPGPHIESHYMKSYSATLIKSEAWIRKNCSGIAWLQMGLFDWIKGVDADAWSDHVDLQARLDELIEQRAPIELFEKTLAGWARLYCQIAQRAHRAMILELNTDLRMEINGLG